MGDFGGRKPPPDCNPELKGRQDDREANLGRPVRLITSDQAAFACETGAELRMR
jgi:hypothetical protein